MKYTLEDLLESLGPGELELWYELHKRTPLGNTWLQTGVICSTIANYNPWGTTRVLQPIEFIPIDRTPASPDQLHRKFLAAMAGLGIPIVKAADVDTSCSTSPAK